MVTSSAVVGSSARMSLGLHESAGDADELEQLDRPLPRLAPVHLQVELERLGDLTADREHRIQARHRVLEDHRDVVAADPADLVVVHLQDVLTVEHDRALHDPARWHRDEPHEREGGDGLAAAGLAHEPQRLAGRELEGHAVHRAHDAVAREELRVQVPDR